MSEKQATVTWKGDQLHFSGELGSGYTFDLSSEAGAEHGGSPMEFLLAGVAGCTAVDVVMILGKMRQQLTGLRVEIRGERATEHPKVYTDVEIVYVLSGVDLDPNAVERAIALSEETYCSASAMFTQAGTAVSHSYRIE